MGGEGFAVKDSGERQQFESGMVRDVETDKVDYTLILDGPMLERWAEHMTKGAQKYAARNWMKAQGVEELERFKRSALRHMIQWLAGDTDEDHAAAVMFNINGAEYVRESMLVGDYPEPGVYLGHDGSMVVVTEAPHPDPYADPYQGHQEDDDEQEYGVVDGSGW